MKTTMYQRVEIDCPALDKIGQAFSAAGDWCSLFFRPHPPTPRYPTPPYPNFGLGHSAVLAEVLRSEFFGQAIPKLVPLNTSTAMRFATLNRYEFEGSLVGALMDGSCTEDVVADENEARGAVRAVLECVVKPHGTLTAFRLDDPSWSSLTESATFSWAYLVYESFQQLWWLVCFADHY